MDTTAQILSALFGLAIVLMISPRVLRMNRGKTLQNIALWLAIFLGLALAYKSVGPGGSIVTAADQSLPSAATNADAPSDASEEVPPPALKEEDGFSPPRE